VKLFVVLRVVDVALAVSAAVAATAAGAHTAGVPLTPEILWKAAVGGAVKSGVMAFAGLAMMAPQIAATRVWMLLLLLATSIGTNVLLVATIANRTLGYGEETRGMSPFHILPCRLM
jgi:hypothetical protein